MVDRSFAALRMTRSCHSERREESVSLLISSANSNGPSAEFSKSKPSQAKADPAVPVGLTQKDKTSQHVMREFTKRSQCLEGAERPPVQGVAVTDIVVTSVVPGPSQFTTKVPLMVKGG